MVQYLAVPHLSFVSVFIVKNVPSEVSCISCLTEVRLSFVGAIYILASNKEVVRMSCDYNLGRSGHNGGGVTKQLCGSVCRRL